MNTFSIFDGIGQRLERRLWREGILTWNNFLDTKALPFMNPSRKKHLDESLFSAYTNLTEENAEYFTATVQRNEHWRLFDVFKDDAVCLDIETNGFPANRGGYVTLVGLYNGRDYTCFIRGENLSAEALNEELSKYKYLITFYGSVFDIPFLKTCMKGLRFDIPHFDLCFAARRLGLKGGLKKLEPCFGIQRPEEVKEMNGYDAVLLWNKVKKGNSNALDLLLLYNREDTVNLFDMADSIYQRLKASTGIEEYLG